MSASDRSDSFPCLLHFKSSSRLRTIRTRPPSYGKCSIQCVESNRILYVVRHSQPPGSMHAKSHIEHPNVSQQLHNSPRRVEVESIMEYVFRSPLGTEHHEMEIIVHPPSRAGRKRDGGKVKVRFSSWAQGRRLPPEASTQLA